jgi:hypothetical protein
MRLPVDNDLNRIPDAGWSIEGVTVSNTGLTPASDADANPVAVGNPVPGSVGDGLTVFEEYRGFVVDGVHTRTNPAQKDLFVSYIVHDSLGIGFAMGLPTSTHPIRGEDEFPRSYEYGPERVINFNRANAGFPGPISGYDQRAVRMYAISTPMNAMYGLTCGVESEPEPDCLTWLVQLPPNTTLPMHTPNSTREVRVYLVPHDSLTDATECELSLGAGQGCPYTEAQAQNELRRTAAHEIGHSVRICHRGQCSPLDDSGVASSVMSSSLAQGPPQTSPLSQYNSFDIGQIRLHER